MKQSGYTRPLTGFLLLSALCMAWIWLEPEIRYLVWDYTAKTFDVLSRRLFLFGDYLCYGLLLAGRGQLNRRLSASLWWINGLCLIGALALYFMQFDEKLMLRRYHKFQKNAAISFINIGIGRKSLKNECFH